MVERCLVQAQPGSMEGRGHDLALIKPYWREKGGGVWPGPEPAVQGDAQPHGGKGMWPSPKQAGQRKGGMAWLHREMEGRMVWPCKEEEGVQPGSNPSVWKEGCATWRQSGYAGGRVLAQL